MKISTSILTVFILASVAGCSLAQSANEQLGEVGREPRSDKPLTDGPPSPGPHGPLSASDTNKDGTVTQAEIESFMSESPYRRIGLVPFFDQCDQDKDQRLSDAELVGVEPDHAFNGTDKNADGVVTRAEVEDYVSDRLYRRIGLEAFFELLDTDQNGELSPTEIETAHSTGQLPHG